MKKNLLPIGLLLATALVACPSTPVNSSTKDDLVIPPSGTTASEAQLNTAIEQVQRNANAAFEAVRASSNAAINEFKIPSVPKDPLSPQPPMVRTGSSIEFLQALGFFMPKTVTLQASTESFTLLPTGILDCTVSPCTNAASDDVIYRWKDGTKLGEAIIDWNGNTDGVASDPIKAFTGEYSNSQGTLQRFFTQLPTKARAKVTFDNKVVVEAKIDITYAAKTGEAGIFIANPICSMGYCSIFPLPLFSETAKVAVTVKKADGTAFATLNLDENVNAVGGPSLKMDAVLNNDVVRKIGFNAKFGGTISKDTAGYWKDFVFNGDTSVNASVLDGTKLTAVSGKINTVIRNVSGGLESVMIAPSSISHDGKLVTFAGKLDDANKNCVAGEGVTINFADSQKTLEQYSISKGTPTCK